MLYFIWYILFFRGWELGVVYLYVFKYCFCFENCRYFDKLVFNYNYFIMLEIDRVLYIILDGIYSKN